MWSINVTGRDVTYQDQLEAAYIVGRFLRSMLRYKTKIPKLPLLLICDWTT